MWGLSDMEIWEQSGIRDAIKAQLRKVKKVRGEWADRATERLPEGRPLMEKA